MLSGDNWHLILPIIFIANRPLPLPSVRKQTFLLVHQARRNGCFRRLTPSQIRGDNGSRKAEGNWALIGAQYF